MTRHAIRFIVVALVTMAATPALASITEPEPVFPPPGDEEPTPEPEPTPAPAPTPEPEPAPAPTPVDASDCSDENVFCLDPVGRPYAGDRAPFEMSQKETLDVKVIGCPEEHENVVFALSMTHVARLEQLLEPSISPEDVACTDEVLQSAQFELPDDIAIARVRVRFERTSGKQKITRTTTITVDHGKYYVTVGLLVPFVPNGKSEVVGRAVAGTDERTAAYEEDLHVTAAIALNVFPGGRRRGSLSPFHGLRCDGRTGDDRKRCRRRAHGRRAAELIGLQAAIDYDVRDLSDQFYFGVVFEPLTGFGISAGAAVLRMNKLPPGVSNGQLVASSADLRASQSYAVRPYFGLMLSLDLIQALRAFRNEIAELEP